ncbi:hypothetical protein [Cyanobacterium aponinum]|uniref:hypothetical protein n=1 Tax=Cyanobacterium aponinum TaxID=379064 RepID=UPI001F559DD0|nr:hypothetical protein [Cyanobacterium aponinum]
MKIKDYFFSSLPYIIFIFCISVIGILQKPLLNEEKVWTSEDFARQDSVIKAQLNLLQKLPTLGFDNLLASWAYLNFIQYYGDYEGRNLTGYSLLPDYYKVIVEKDPRFTGSYLLLDTATTLFAGRPDVSVDLINYGLKYLTPEIPLAYQVLMYKGTDELLFLGKTEEAQKSFETASEWATIANTETSLAIAQRAKETAQFLKNNPDSKLARASSWLMIFSNAREDVVRQLALSELKKLGAIVTFEGNTVSVKMPED